MNNIIFSNTFNINSILVKYGHHNNSYKSTTSAKKNVNQ